MAMVLLIRWLLSSLVVTSRQTFLRNSIAQLVGPTVLPFSTGKSSSSEKETNDHHHSSWTRQSEWIRSQVSIILDQDDSLAGPLLRLAFHDAVGSPSGPNASIQFGLEYPQNRGLSRPLDIVTKLHDAVTTTTLSTEKTLSLADIIALAGSEAVRHAGGPHIPIRLGRIDATIPIPDIQPTVRSTTALAASQTDLKSKDVDATSSSPISITSQQESLYHYELLPSPAMNSDGLREYFGRLGLSEPEFVALSGSHGMGRHVSLLGMDKQCLKNLTRQCLETAPVLLPFVTSSVDQFDNSYFKLLLQWYDRNIVLGQVAFLPTDVAMVVDSGLQRHVKRFATNQDAYFRSFVSSYQKLVERSATTMDRY